MDERDYDFLNVLERFPSKKKELELLAKFEAPIFYDPDDSLSNIQLVDVMGDDAAIVAAARVSYGGGTRKVSQDEALIRYLVNHAHTSPQEMCEIKFRIKCPIYVVRQLIRHRTANVNEESARYSLVSDEFQNTPAGAWRLQSANNKQGSGARFDESDMIELGKSFSEREAAHYQNAYALYKDMLDAGVAREQARKVLPLSSYTSFYWKMDARNLFHFLKLRLDSHAQLEIRLLAEAIYKVVEEWLPATTAAFQHYQLNSVTFSESDGYVVAGCVRGFLVRDFEESVQSCREDFSAFSKREEEDLKRKLQYLGFPIH